MSGTAPSEQFDPLAHLGEPSALQAGSEGAPIDSGDALADLGRPSAELYLRSLPTSAEDQLTFETPSAEWDPALDRFRAARLLALGLRRMAATSDYSRDPVLHRALDGLHALACRMALEVDTLIRAGLPLGALMIGRSMHEASVRAKILSDHHGTSTTPDLANRFMRHSAIETAYNVTSHGRTWEANQINPYSDELQQAAAENARTVTNKDGTEMGAFSGLGWARGLPIQKGRRQLPTFTDLERLAGFDDMRTSYRHTSHLVHTNAFAIIAYVSEPSEGPTDGSPKNANSVRNAIAFAATALMRTGMVLVMPPTSAIEDRALLTLVALCGDAKQFAADADGT